eukprot:1278325-Prymnesium_polylepis.2
MRRRRQGHSSRTQAAAAAQREHPCRSCQAGTARQAPDLSRWHSDRQQWVARHLQSSCAAQVAPKSGGRAFPRSSRTPAQGCQPCRTRAPRSGTSGRGAGPARPPFPRSARTQCAPTRCN